MGTRNPEIISKEIIRPSSPTPDNLRNYKLSFLDQYAPTTYIPIILFYHAKNSHDNIDPIEKSCQLKKSLEQTLNRFYPLAGSVKEDQSIECDDEGVEYYEARVSCKLSQVLQQFNIEILNQFLPFEPCRNIGAEIKPGSRECLLAVQCNIFECGGIAIGLCVSHRIADGASALTFVGAWSAACRGDAVYEAVSPKFDAAMYFPPKDVTCGVANAWMTKEKIVTRRLVFEKSSIAALKDEAFSASGSQMKQLPTRVEAVSAFLWKRLMEISKSKAAAAGRMCIASHAVNIRERMVPPMPMAFGNLWSGAAAILSQDEHDSNIGILANRLSDAIKGINGDSVKKQSDNVTPESITEQAQMFSSGHIDMYKFTSWCRFPFYETDFGWGNPTWVSCLGLPFSNLALLMNTRDGQGIEAFVNILEEDAPVFDADQQILPFVSSTIGD